MKYILIFLALVVGFFYQTIVYRKLPVPTDTLIGLYHPWRDLYAQQYPRGIPFKNFLITDPVRQQIPWRKIAVDSWKQAQLPTFNAFAFFGVPLDANVQAAPYYPLNVLFLFLNFPVAWTLLIMLQPLLAGVFLYLYLRNLKLSPTASILGAITWAFGGFTISWLTWGTIVHTSLWLPLILFAIDTRRSSLLGFSLVMTLLAGHVQIALYVTLFSAAYFFWRKRKLAPYAIAVAALLTSVQWIPLFRFLLESARVGAVESWKTAGWFLPWQHLAQFIAPDFFGNPATLNYWGVWNYGEFVGYIGVIPLILALSVVTVKGVTRFFVVAAGVSLLFMLPHPLSRLPFQLHIPLVSILQPTRLMVLVDFSLAVLAAFGLDRLRHRTLQESIFFYGVALAALWLTALLMHIDVAKRNLVVPSVLFGGFIVWRLVKNMPLAILLAITIIDLFRFGWKFIPFTPKEYFFPTTKVIEFLQNQPKPFRVMSLDDRILPPNVSAYYGIESIEGYDPIAPKNYEAFLGASERGNADTSKESGFNRIYTAHNIDSPLLPYMNVRYVLTLAPVKRPYLREIMREGETRVYEYTSALPRVYLAEDINTVPIQDEALQALFERTSAYRGIWAGHVDIMNAPVLADETVSIVSYGTATMRLRVAAINQRLLVVLNRYDRRWRATIDGDSSYRIIPVNYLFMGVVIPPGTHDVILSYH